METKYFKRNSIFPNALDQIDADTKIIVVIPAFKENNLLHTLRSLLDCEAPSCRVEVIVVNNLPMGSDSSAISEQHLLNADIVALSSLNSFLKFLPLAAFELPVDSFGAGLARKIGMDLAANRFFNIGRYDGVIVSLDADCFVQSNYFVEIEKCFLMKSISGATLYFEHPLEGDLPLLNYAAITQYELHLRYFNLMLRLIHFPKAFHTVGSSFAVRADAYVKAGGMTKKIAGEDFYFIQKLLSLGGYCDLLSTTVYPSARVSSRVLFGTGAAVTKFVDEEASDFYTFNPYSFLFLKKLFSNASCFYEVSSDSWEDIISGFDESLLNFICVSDLLDELKKLKANCSNLKVFQKRFFSIVDSLWVVRYLNFAHEGYLSKVPIFEAANLYLQFAGKYSQKEDVKSLLILFRQIERNSFD